jgi:4-hydroxybenzoate polyprenyltransferase
MNSTIAFFKLIRWKNLTFIVLGQFLVKYYLDKFITNPAFDALSFTLLVFSTICIAAAGYIINDIYDLDVDNINKPERVIINKLISEKIANKLYLILNILGLTTGYYLSIRIGNESLFTFFLMSSALLYFYSITLKKIFLIGNLVIASLIGFSLILVVIFDLYEVFQTKNIDFTVPNAIFKTVLYYAGFASFLNLIREILKDIEDYEGDKQMDYKTMVVLLGTATSKIFILILNAILIAVLIYLSYTIFSANNTVLFYLFGLIILSIYLFFRIIESQEKTDFSKLSLLLKLIMLYGIFGIVLL